MYDLRLEPWRLARIAPMPERTEPDSVVDVGWSLDSTRVVSVTESVSMSFYDVCVCVCVCVCVWPALPSCRI